jgi:hypothetical protein
MSGSGRIGKTPHKQLPMQTPSSKTSGSSSGGGDGGSAMGTPQLMHGSSANINSYNDGRGERSRNLYTPAHFTLSKNPHLNMDGNRPEAFSPNTIRMTDSLDKLLMDDFGDDDDAGTAAGGSVGSSLGSIGGGSPKKQVADLPFQFPGSGASSLNNSIDTADQTSSIGSHGAFRRIQSTNSDESSDDEELEEMESLAGGGASISTRGEGSIGDHGIEGDQAKMDAFRPQPLRIGGAFEPPKKKADVGTYGKPGGGTAGGSLHTPKPQRTMPRPAPTQPHGHPSLHYGQGMMQYAPQTSRGGHPQHDSFFAPLGGGAYPSHTPHHHPYAPSPPTYPPIAHYPHYPPTISPNNGFGPIPPTVSPPTIPTHGVHYPPNSMHSAGVGVVADGRGYLGSADYSWSPVPPEFGMNPPREWHPSTAQTAGGWVAEQHSYQHHPPPHYPLGMAISGHASPEIFHSMSGHASPFMLQYPYHDHSEYPPQHHPSHGAHHVGHSSSTRQVAHSIEDSRRKYQQGNREGINYDSSLGEELRRPRKDSSASINSGVSSAGSIEQYTHTPSTKKSTSPVPPLSSLGSVPPGRTSASPEGEVESSSWFPPQHTETQKKANSEYSRQQSLVQPFFSMNNTRGISDDFQSTGQGKKHNTTVGGVVPSQQTLPVSALRDKKGKKTVVKEPKGQASHNTSGGEEIKRVEFTETPQERAAFKEFGRSFRQKENESLIAARDYALACISPSNPDIYLPPATHWRVFLELADLAKRSNEIEDARQFYIRACKQQPKASQGWLEHSKLEEESGNLRKCASILEEGLNNCTLNENL